jgi:hypothetical protein
VISIALVGLLSATPHVHAGRATTFDRAALDEGNPDDRLACKPWRRLRAKDRIVATYRLPCGTRIELYAPRTRKRAVGVVWERGPVRTRHGKLQNDLDLSAALARRLDSNGFERVAWWIRKP